MSVSQKGDYMNCRGCREEKEMAYEEQVRGNHVATTPDWPCTYPVGDHHYCSLIVDDDGKIIVS